MQAPLEQSNYITMLSISDIVGAILKEVSISETIKWCLSMQQKAYIFHYSENYGSLTHVTRLKLQ